MLYKEVLMHVDARLLWINVGTHQVKTFTFSSLFLCPNIIVLQFSFYLVASVTCSQRDLFEGVIVLQSNGTFIINVNH